MTHLVGNYVGNSNNKQVQFYIMYTLSNETIAYFVI